MPCFLYKNNIVCYLWNDKKTGEPYILLAEGLHLKHPKLEQGKRSKMKILRINPNADFPIENILTVLKDAIGLH